MAVDARGADNRVEQFRVVTTILDESVDGGQIGNLYERRWQGELDLRSIKSVMRMDVLRCKSPEMVGKEIWAHLLAYDLLRTVMAVAAAQSEVEPRQISFKGAKQAVTAFAPKIEAARPEERGRLIDALLRAVAHDRVGHRPGPMGAASAQAQGQAGPTPDAPASLHQTAAESVEVLLS